MQIVVTAFLDESQALVEESTRLVDLYQHKQPDFPDRLVDWLRRAEEALKRHRRSQLAPLSALRVRALAAIAGPVALVRADSRAPAAAAAIGRLLG